MKLRGWEIAEIVYVPPNANWQFPLHEHDDSVELSLVVDGRGYFYCENRKWMVEKGHLVVKNAGLAHAEKTDAAHPMEQICLSVRDTSPGAAQANQLLPPSSDPVLDVSEYFPLFTGCFHLLKDHHREPRFEEACQSALSLILELVSICIRTAEPHHETRRKKGEEVIREVKAYLDGQYRQKIILTDLADRFYISVGHLSRQFKQYTGYTVNQYVVSKRMGAAQKMLLFEDRSIKEIANLCGYTDLQYFYNVFRRFANCTPVQFRELYGRKSDQQSP